MKDDREFWERDNAFTSALDWLDSYGGVWVTLLVIATIVLVLLAAHHDISSFTRGAVQ